MKEEILLIIYELWEKFKYSEGGDTAFIIDGKYYNTDTGYAMDGIDYYVTELQKEIEKYFNNK